jgi:ribulose kinase
MAEGGQSSTGQVRTLLISSSIHTLIPSKLIDFIITSHPAYNELLTESESSGRPIHSILEDTLEKLRIEAKAATLTELTRDIHFYPDLHGSFRSRYSRLEAFDVNDEYVGNRTPLADPQMRGSITGLTLDVSLNDLAVKYNVTLEVGPALDSALSIEFADNR